MAEQATRFVFGVNYWPRCKAMNWWKAFDSKEVEEEFTLIKSMGLLIVRIFLLWEDFQPTIDSINQKSIENLQEVARIAQTLELKLDVTFFTGHMSGPNWVPSWLLDPSVPLPAPHVRQVISENGNVILSRENGGYKDIYSYQPAREAAFLLISTVVDALVNFDSIYCWNLGNEPDLLVSPANEAEVLSWVNNICQIIHEKDTKQRPINFGLHILSLVENNGFRADKIATEINFASMHAYPMYTSWAKSPLDPNLVPYTCALSSALAGKATLMEEWGGCTLSTDSIPEGVVQEPSPKHPELGVIWKWQCYGEPRTQFMAFENSFRDYVENAVKNLIEIGALGAMMWCFADYHPSLWNLPPCQQSIHERFFGLVRSDGSLKPHAEWLRDFTKESHFVQKPLDFELPLTADEFYQNPSINAIKYYEDYLAAVNKK